MRKVAALVCLALGLVAVPRGVSAAPIGSNGCVLTDIYTCDLYADYDTGQSTLDMSAIDPFTGWLVARTFLLKVGANLADGIQVPDVAHALVIHSWGFELFSPVPAFGSAFDDIVAAALGQQAIDGTPLSDGQKVGTPVPTGVSQLDDVGYFFTAPIVSMDDQISWANIFGAGQDTLRIHTSLLSPPSNPIPEPGSLTLLAVGGAAALARRRRARRSEE